MVTVSCVYCGKKLDTATFVLCDECFKGKFGDAVERFKEGWGGNGNKSD